VPAGLPAQQVALQFVHANANVEPPSWLSQLSNLTVSRAVLQSGQSGLCPYRADGIKQRFT